MFRFAHPYSLLMFIPLALAARAVLGKRAGHDIIFAPTHRLPASIITWRTLARMTMPYLFLLGAGLLIIALARPQTVFSRITQRTDAIAIMMVIDVSGSMEAMDYATPGRETTRLDVAKDVCARFIEKRPHDLIGLVSFGGYAVTHVPLTIDHAALLHSLKDVRIPPLVFNEKGQAINEDERMTAIGDALATACARLENAETKSKIAVFLSDGESNAGIIRPESAIEAARAMGVKVYPIGIGSHGRAPFRTRDMFGRSVIQYARVSIDEELLRKMAAVTGGRYYHVTDPEGLEQALIEIDKLEKTETERDVFYRYTELFLYFLVPGAFLLLLAASINTVVARHIV